MIISIIVVAIFAIHCLVVGLIFDWDKHEIKNRFNLVRAFSVILLTPHMFFERFLFSNEPYSEWQRSHVFYLLLSLINIGILMFVGYYSISAESAHIVPVACFSAYAVGFTAKKLRAKLRSKA